MLEAGSSIFYLLFLIVTHNMAQACRASDECIFMLLGEIMEHSPTEDSFPKNPKTAEYIEGRYGY